MPTTIPGHEAKPVVKNFLDLMVWRHYFEHWNIWLLDMAPYYIRKSNPNVTFEKGDRISGLFPATNDNPDWGQTCRVLFTAFGHLAVERMYDEM
ncbi:hypothetical protein EYC84_007169 [Monilinia fructicola]|uniref:Uncharacterized protein n=1 Tax=Monilinia fructicola TaxID=38448 RepID=A0A5M9K9W2_MONFR|nr:hypothetical protein EYC84_007169 [Monilinia fructicola]